MNWVRVTSLIALVSLVTSPYLAAQAQDSPEKLIAAANTAYQAKEWATAEPLYARLTEVQPDNYAHWLRLGVCEQASGKHQKAIEAFQMAEVKGLPASTAKYNIAAAFASMGQTEKALDALAEAVKQGYGQPEQLRSDADLRSIRGEARFAALLEQAKRNQTPCDYKSENRQFDFWIGDWEALNAQTGAPAGISHIEPAIGNCVIWENWTSLGNSGYTGKSYNIFNPDLKRWEQFWVDNQGGMIHFYGGLKDGVMDYYTDDVPQPDGSKLRRHLQFFNVGPDKVRQFSQGSTDGGKSWTVEYDLTYNRKK